MFFLSHTCSFGSGAASRRLYVRRRLKQRTLSRCSKENTCPEGWKNSIDMMPGSDPKQNILLEYIFFYHYHKNKHRVINLLNVHFLLHKKRICWEWWKLKCNLVFLVCLNLKTSIWKVSLRFCVIFCMYEHIWT